YQGRALPLVWRVRQCPKGHCPADLHIALVELVLELIPEGTKVVFLGDGEFDGIQLQETMHEAGWWYACRTSKGNTATWDDETFFSDQKSRGFNIHKSHLTDPQRLSRLLIASCLAYIWLVYLGALCQKERWQSTIHRRKRCDLSLFQLGLRLLEHFLNEELPIPVQFHVIIY